LVQSKRETLQVFVSSRFHPQKWHPFFRLVGTMNGVPWVAVVKREGSGRLRLLSLRRSNARQVRRWLAGRIVRQGVQ